MFLSKSLFSIAAAMSLTLAATAQGGLGGVFTGSLGGIYTGTFTPVLPPVEFRYDDYQRSIGNSWLGGSIYAYAQMLRQKQGTYELGMAAAELRATATVLQHGSEVFEIVGSATNVMNNGTQQRSGLFRIEVLGYAIINSSFANSSTFANASQQFSLIPGGVSVSVPVGPVSVTIGGNAGCGYSRSANWLLPAATATVGLNAAGSCYAFANASVSFGIPGFNVGVGLQGHILQQALAANVNASAVYGLSGGVTYTLQAISLHLYAWATAIWTWTTTLCSWSSPAITINLI